ncbi:hypothetical protein C0Q70_05033 [Pomacea canaliculata]|uniref:Uncharacterized protein n=1 Tax=Pomacea canaliculata TaxID=400727 RepID=A0A2T7PK22_POMCA|nr:uncharacterized protein LOC112559768 isoform X1 [Pomacea canaliculata]XP_025086942.1 uncharacterized protein LOC112559768 isoform X1 [Pomacea canaliculata]PVD33773.1 hypothetical protein C0Q70_05033 [Pomacea canaliculata]
MLVAIVMLRPRPQPPVCKNQMNIPVQSLGFSSSSFLDRSLFDDCGAATRRSEVTGREACHDRWLSGTDAVRPCSPTDTKSDRTLLPKLAPVLEQGQGVAHANDLDDEKARWSSVMIRKEMKRGKPRRPENDRSTSTNKTVNLPILSLSTWGSVTGKRRRKKSKHEMWTVTQLPVLAAPGETESGRNPAVNTLDVRSIYGKQSKTLNVKPGLPGEGTIVLPPLTLSRPWGQVQAGTVDDSLRRKQPVRQDTSRTPPGKKWDSMSSLDDSRTFVNKKRRQQRLVLSEVIFDAGGGAWENHRHPVSCLTTDHAATAAHYCDVLGRRFCHRCTEWVEKLVGQSYGARLVGHSYEARPVGQSYGARPVGLSYEARPVGQSYEARLVGQSYGARSVGHSYEARPVGQSHRPSRLMRLASKSPTPTWVSDRELSFTGVRKVIITKATKIT